MNFMRERARRARENARKRIAREVTGLFARVNVWNATPEALIDVRKGDRVDRADLYALTTFDARPQECVFTPRTRRPESSVGSSNQRPIGDRLKYENREARQAGSNQRPSSLLLSTETTARFLLDRGHLIVTTCHVRLVTIRHRRGYLPETLPR
jgi:hypothetical protein